MLFIYKFVTIIIILIAMFFFLSVVAYASLIDKQIMHYVATSLK